MVTNTERYEKYFQAHEWVVVWGGLIATIQALLWLSTHWNINVKAAFTSTTAKDVASAKLIKVHPIANAGKAEICPVVHEEV